MKLFLFSIFVVLALFVACSTAQPGVENIEASEARSLVSNGALLVDVRSDSEYESGHIDGAIHIPHDQIADRISELGSDKSRKIVLYCRSGRRAGGAAGILVTNGFTEVYNAGGYSSLAN